jgi:signal transduction histidine kinase
MKASWAPIRRYLRICGIAAIFATIPALSIVLAMVKQGRATFAEAFHHEGVLWYGWALVTPFILWAARRFPVDQPPRLRAISIHIAFGILCGLFQGLLSIMLFSVFGPPAYEEVELTHGSAIAIWIPFGVFFYGMTATIGFALDYHAKLREREQAAAQLKALLVESQLGALRMQLQPHFLFNALNTVSMLVRQGDANTSVRVLARLAELIRQLLDDEAPQEVPLETELEFVGRYLEIERVRFGDRLEVRIDADDEARATPVPHLLLQPLVENAIRHGIARRAEATRIDVVARRRDGFLHIEVNDDGPGLPPDWSDERANGIGLRNTRRRLQFLYGEAGVLEIGNAPAGGARVSVSLPARRPGEND